MDIKSELTCGIRWAIKNYTGVIAVRLHGTLLDVMNTTNLDLPFPCQCPTFPIDNLCFFEIMPT